MKRIVFLIILVLTLSMTACGQNGADTDASLSLGAVLDGNALSSQSQTAIKVTDTDGSMSDYYNDKNVKSIVNGYWDGKMMTIVTGYDTLWDSDFVFYLYNGNAYSQYSKYDDMLRYADLSGIDDLQDGYPASQFRFLEKWEPSVVSTATSDGITKVVYEVTAQDDDSFEYYFSADYDDIKPGTKLYFELELNSDNKITTYSLSRDKDGTDAVWAKYTYTYVTLNEYNPESVAEFDSKYDKQELVTISLVDTMSEQSTTEYKIQKGAPFYAEISQDKVLYLDKECTKAYLDYELKYTTDNGKQFAVDKDTVLYIGAK